MQKKKKIILILFCFIFILSGCSIKAKSFPSGTLDDLEYCCYSSDYGAWNGFGYMIKEVTETSSYYNNYKYEIIVSDGSHSSGGDGITIDSMSYNSKDDILCIEIEQTKLYGGRTAAFTYPSCGVYLNKLPKNIKITRDGITLTEQDSSTVKYPGPGIDDLF